MAYNDILKNLKQTPPRAYNDHILVIDAMNMLIRSFSLLKAMNPDGTHIGGIVGFLRSLGYVTRIFDPTRVIVVWDGKGGSGNRKNINPKYKAHRATARITHWGLYDTKEQEMEALIGQLFRVQEYLECLPIVQVTMDKLEADDIIAYIATNTNKKVTIVSSDKDFLQLINKNVEVYAPVKKKTYTKDNVQEEIKVLPENYNIVKALLGDHSDGVRGVKGLGIKTIVSEWKSFCYDPGASLQDIYDHCETQMELEKPKKIFAKILHEWQRVKNNFEIMDLHQTSLDDKEIESLKESIKTEVSKTQIGAFIQYLDDDNIEGITKNTVGWLDNFRGLIVK